MYYTVWKSTNNGLWYWNLKSANHQIIANGEGYYNKQDALDTITIIKGSGGAPVRDG